MSIFYVYMYFKDGLIVKDECAMRGITPGFYHTVACDEMGLNKNDLVKTEHRFHKEPAWGEYGETPYEYSYFYNVNPHLTKLTDDVIFLNPNYIKCTTEEVPRTTTRRTLSEMRRTKFEKRWQKGNKTTGI